jgi:hypothetical protein
MLAILVATGPVSSGAAPPRLTPHRDYVASTAHFRISYVTHSPRVIDAGLAGNGGSQYVTTAVVLDCPAVGKTAVVNVGLAQTTLSPVHGAYSFSTSYSLENYTVTAVGAIEQTILTVQVHLTGTVRSASEITGTVQLTGSPCTTPTYSYVARIDAAQTKYIAPNA